MYRLRILSALALTACTAKTASTRSEQVKTCQYLAPDQMRAATASAFRETIVHCLITRYNWTVGRAEGSEDVARLESLATVAVIQQKRFDDSVAHAQWDAAAPQRERARRQNWVTCYGYATFAVEIAACSRKWLTTHGDSVWAEN